MEGQYHANHLTIDDQNATEYDQGVAQYAVMLLQALKEREITKVSKPDPEKKGCFLVTYSLQLLVNTRDPGERKSTVTSELI